MISNKEGVERISAGSNDGNQSRSDSTCVDAVGMGLMSSSPLSGRIVAGSVERRVATWGM